MLGQATEVLAAQGIAWLHLTTHERHTNCAAFTFSMQTFTTLLHVLLDTLSRPFIRASCMRSPHVEVDDSVVQELVCVQARQVQVGHLHRAWAAARRVQALEAL